ncbi:MAG TPA: riboflavin synthase [Microbacteriaceae bacterium]|nr:riboflavin synthase [Microbacteriaceae bacterium]
MFTGLVEEIGEIVAVEASGDGTRLTVRAPLAVEDAQHGASIAVSGVCLTVVGWGSDWFAADVMRETVDVTTIGAKSPGTRVNVERALRADDRLGGHIVQGHVDGTSEVLDVRPGDAWRVIRFALDPEHAPLVTKKGSITVDGVSLTVSDAGTDWFEVSLIPETLEATTLGALAVGDRVNIETDILARHIARLIRFQEVTR